MNTCQQLRYILSNPIDIRVKKLYLKNFKFDHDFKIKNIKNIDYYFKGIYHIIKDYINNKYIQDEIIRFLMSRLIKIYFSDIYLILDTNDIKDDFYIFLEKFIATTYIHKKKYHISLENIKILRYQVYDKYNLPLSFQDERIIPTSKTLKKILSCKKELDMNISNDEIINYIYIIISNEKGIDFLNFDKILSYIIIDNIQTTKLYLIYIYDILKNYIHIEKLHTSKYKLLLNLFRTIINSEFYKNIYLPIMIDKFYHILFNFVNKKIYDYDKYIHDIIIFRHNNYISDKLQEQEKTTQLTESSGLIQNRKRKIDIINISQKKKK